MQKKIAFIRMGPWPAANESVLQTFREVFPDSELDVIDVKDLVKRRKDIVLMNVLFAIREYGLDILLGRHTLRECFFRTTYFFDIVRSLIAKHLSKDTFEFSFQMQSLFDAKTENLHNFVYTDHTHLANLHYPDFDRRKLFSKSWIEREKTIYQHASMVFTRSTNIARSVMDQYACEPNKVSCVYAGSNVKVDSVPTAGRDYRAKNILFVGIDWKRKGGPDLLEAFRSVLRVHPDAQLTIVGCSPPASVPNCNIVGRVPLDQVRTYYERASVFCLPTRLEPFGVAFIEALAHRLPVVATNIGAIPDFVLDGEDGYLVETNNVEQLAQALIDLLGDPEKCQVFGERGYHLVSTRYTWKKAVLRIREYIVSITAR